MFCQILIFRRYSRSSFSDGVSINSLTCVEIKGPRGGPKWVKICPNTYRFIQTEETAKEGKRSIR